MADPVWFVVEDGDGDPDATSYVSLTFTDLYHERLGNRYWSLLDPTAKYNCMVKATLYIEKRFGQRFRGIRLQKDQAFSWPRLAAYDNDNYSIDGVPVKLQQATAEYALRAAIYNVLAPDPQRMAPAQDMGSETPNDGNSELIVGPVRLKTEKVGPLEETTAYDTPAQYRSGTGSANSRDIQSNTVNDVYVPQYPEADLLIEQLLTAGSAITLERA